MAKPKKKLAAKHFSGYIDGDDTLRKQIFKNKPATQQVIFELFSCMDHVYYGFFQFLCSIPSTAFWDLITARLSATASVADRNRNFCEDYNVLSKVTEEPSDYRIARDKITDLVGASHAVWFSLADPEYEEHPDTHALWMALHDVNPSRVVWEWWLDSTYAELQSMLKKYKHDLTEPDVISALEDWAQESFGLLKPRTHFWVLIKYLTETCEEIKILKNKIASPYLRLVYTVTKKIAAYNQPDQFHDTYAMGCTGLMRSIAKYAPSMSLAFPTFAAREIRYEIYYQLSNYNMVALPHRTWQKYRKFEDMRNEYHRQYGKELTLSEFISIFHLNKEETYDVYSQVGLQNPCSLDQTLYPDDEPQAAVDVTLKDKIEDPRILELRGLIEDQEVILLTLKRMPLRERQFFIFSNNLCELVHDDLAPDKDEVLSFFLNQPDFPQTFSTYI